MQTMPLALAHSLLFVPGNRPDRFDKALGSGAHAIALDLEDAVAPQDKDAARAAVAGWLATGANAVVRVNGAGTPWFDADMEMLARFAQAGLMLPKADAASVALANRALPRRPIVALVESIRGYMELARVAATPGVLRLAFGSIDFGTETGISDVGEAMSMVRSRFVLESCFAGIAAPIDGVSTSVEDAARVLSDATRAQQFGFGGKLCIHPRQVDPVNRAFLPSEAEADWARRVLVAMAASGGGATTVDGKMIDKPVEEQARRILGKFAPAAS